MWKRRDILLALATGAGLAGAHLGCSADDYRASADRDVQELIRQRQQQTVGHSADVDVAPTTQPTVPKPSYDLVPLTRVPEVDKPPVRRERYEPRYDPMGPPAPTGVELPDVEDEVFNATGQMQRQSALYGPPRSAGNVTRLDLFAAVHYAVQNSRAYQSQMEDLYLSALDVTLQRHLFTPRPFVTTSAQYTGGQKDVDYRSALSITQRAGVRQKLPYGGEIVAQGLVEFINALNDNVADGENAELAIRGSIPLWRGAGLVNLEPLIQSERELIYTTRSFEQYRRSFAVDVASQYFNVLISYKSVRNRYLNYRNLLDLVDRTEALFAAGRVTALEVQRAQQSLLSAEDSLNSSYFALQSDLDDFKILIGMPVDEPLELVQIDIEVAALDAQFAGAESAALKYRLDLQTARDRIEDAMRGTSNAANQLGPSLDLSGGAALGNRTGTPGKDIDSRTLDYDAALTLDLPVDRLPERNEYRRSLIALEQSKRRLVDLRETILSDVRTAERSIRSAKYSVDIQRAGIELARQRLDFANESLLLGRVTNSREVVEAQQSLLNAQDAFDRARARLTIQMLQFLRDTGTLRVDPNAGALGLAMQRGG